MVFPNALMAGACQFGQLMGDIAPFPQDQGQMRLRLKSLIGRIVAGNETTVHQGERELQIVRVIAIAFFEGSGSLGWRASPNPTSLGSIDEWVP